MIYVGIDPGVKGGIAALGENFHLVEPMPDAHYLADLFDEWNRKHKIAHVCLEKGQAMPWHSRSSTYTYGEHCGYIQGTLYTLRIPFTLVAPTIWQKIQFKGTAPKKGKKKRDPKERALEAAVRLWPREKFLASNRSSKPHDGMIDAMHIADYCKKMFLR